LGRTIYRLLVAEAAGDPLSAEEREQLATHSRTLWRNAMAVRRVLGLDQDPLPFDEQHEAVLKRIRYLSDTTDDPAKLRELNLLLVEIVESFQAIMAQEEGRFLRERRGHQQGQRQTVQTKREAGLELRREIEDIRKRHPSAKLTAAARTYLRETEPAWGALSAEQQSKRIKSLVKRLGRAQKKDDTR
jgi:hypothetical protein